MTQKKPAWTPPYCDDIQGERREEIIDEHLQWLEARNREPTDDRSGYPLARWLAKHRQRLARHRTEAVSYYRNTKPKGQRAGRQKRS